MQHAKRNRRPTVPALLLSCLLLLATGAAVATGNHRVVFHVDSDDPATQAIALNNAVNLQKLYGMDNVEIEVVAYGPGLSMLTQKSSQAERVSSLAQQNITFSACGNTIDKVTKKTGKPPVLLDGVGVVTAGVARIMELQEQGWSYIRP